MHSSFRTVLLSVCGISILMIFILGFHLGGAALLKVGIYSPLLGSFIGGIMVLVSVNIRSSQQELLEPWVGREKIAWILIGCGCIAWGIGECFWRYFLAHGETPFPSLADVGYASFFPLVFWGLIWQPTASTANRRIFLLLDSLIATGALLSIAWFLLLGSLLAQTSVETTFAKVLGLYYPTSDIVLLSCIVFLFLRGHDRISQVRARRLSLLIVGCGVGIYAISDFLFNVLQNMGVSVDGTWADLGWPLGMMTVGIAAYLRRFLPKDMRESVPEEKKRESVPEEKKRESVPEEKKTDDSTRSSFGLAQLLPYLLLGVLFIALAINVFSTDKVQQSIRPVLLIATLIVVCLVVARQIVTIQENERLLQEQMKIHKQLEQIYQDIALRKTALETGLTHLKEIQTRLANGDVRARASILDGELWPLANGLNLMADRMMRSEQRQQNTQKTINAIADLSRALEQRGSKTNFILPASSMDASPEFHHLLLVLGLRSVSGLPPSQR